MLVSGSMASSTCLKFVGRKLQQIQALRQQLVLTACKTAPILLQTQVAHASSKHYDIKWRSQRKAKVKKIDLPNFDEKRSDQKLSPDEMRMKMKKEGRLPPRTFMERPINISSTGTVFEAYVPPEGDGKSSVISKEGAKQRFTELEKRGKSYLELRKIRKYEDFETKDFARMVQDLYIETHQLMENFKDNEDRLHDLVTEKAYPEMMFGLEAKSIRWNFVQSLEPPRVVHLRTTDLFTKENLYAQVTVRMHTQQTLAIYDRFGRLMFGSEVVAKDILEYVVFEKHIANEYGLWRIHGKIIPDWMPPREPLIKTYRKPVFKPTAREKDVKSGNADTDSQKSSEGELSTA